LRECEEKKEEVVTVQVGAREREQYVQQYELATFEDVGCSGIGGADSEVVVSPAQDWRCE
jgi:hypothetical protein